LLKTGPGRGAEALTVAPSRDYNSGCAPSLGWGGYFSSEACLPDKDFVMACGQTWKKNHTDF
jgi:hypothetical protein